MASIFSGNDLISSTNVRLSSIPEASNWRLALNSETSLLKRPVTSITGRLVFAPSSDGKRADNRLDRRTLDGVFNRVVDVGPDRVFHVAQQHCLFAQLPTHDAVLHRHAGDAEAGLCAADLRDPEHIAGKFVGRNLVEYLAINTMHEEQAGIGLGLVRDHLVVRLDSVLVLLGFVLVVGHGLGYLALIGFGLILCVSHADNEAKERGGQCASGSYANL